MITDEQAKLGQEIVETGRDLAKYLANTLGDLPKDLMGLLIGDKVKVLRAKRIAVLWKETEKLLWERGISEPETPSLKQALPILEAAADENRNELLDIWARLLAAAMDPKRRDFVRQSFIQIVKQIDPQDVLVLRAIADNGQAQWTPSGVQAILSRLPMSSDEVRVGLDNLAALNCVFFTDSGPKTNPYLTPLGSLLMRAVRG